MVAIAIIALYSPQNLLGTHFDQVGTQFHISTPDIL